MTGLDALVIAGAGKADSPRPDLFEAQTRATIRYADPAAWIVAAAIANATARSMELFAKSAHEVGVITVSDQGPASSMTEVNAATSKGFSSPIRYAASNPGSFAGVACIAFGFRGPTLNLIMPPQDGVPVALKLCAGWLTRRVARWMVLATHRVIGGGTSIGRSMILGCQDLSPGIGKPFTQDDAEWLVNVDELVSAFHE